MEVLCQTQIFGEIMYQSNVDNFRIKRQLKSNLVVSYVKIIKCEKVNLPQAVNFFHQLFLWSHYGWVFIDGSPRQYEAFTDTENRSFVINAVFPAVKNMKSPASAV
jgi:hypothetical protein